MGSRPTYMSTGLVSGKKGGSAPGIEVSRGTSHLTVFTSVHSRLKLMIRNTTIVRTCAIRVGVHWVPKCRRATGRVFVESTV